MKKYKLCTVLHLDTNYETKGKQYYFKTKDNLKTNDIVLCHTQYGLMVGKVAQPNITLDNLIESKSFYDDVNFGTLRECEKYPSLDKIKQRNGTEDKELPF